MRLPTALLVLSLCASPVLGDDGEPIGVEAVLRDGLATSTRFHISGRILRLDRRALLREKLAARLAQPGRLLDALDTDEAENVHVRILVDGTGYSATTDSDGTFDLDVDGLKAPLPVGAIPFKVSMASPGYTLQRGGDGVLHVLPESGVLVVSDVDDTIMQTFVTEKTKLVKEVLTRDSSTLTPVPGVARAYQEARNAGAVGVVYLSGSPQNFHARIRGFLEHQQLPAGPILLKNVGSDDMLVQHAYKSARLAWLLELFPKLAFVLVGDDGERDPEIYSELRRLHPDRRIAIVIRNTTGARVDAPRFAGCTVVPDYSVDTQVVAREVRGLLPSK